MLPLESTPLLTRKVIDALHVEAMVLADEARAYFEGVGLGARSSLSPITRVIFSCEALKVTTRLMHSVAWLLAQRAHHNGEMPARSITRLGRAPITDAATRASLPIDTVHMIEMSEDIYDRIARLDGRMNENEAENHNPAHQLLSALKRAF